MLSMGNMLFGSIEFLYQSFRTRKLTQVSCLLIQSLYLVMLVFSKDILMVIIRLGQHMQGLQFKCHN